MIGTREALCFLCAFMVALLASLWARDLLGCWVMLVVFPVGSVLGFGVGLVLGVAGDLWGEWIDRVEKRARWLAMAMIVLQLVVMIAVLVAWARIAVGLLGMSPRG